MKPARFGSGCHSFNGLSFLQPAGNALASHWAVIHFSCNSVISRGAMDCVTDCASEIQSGAFRDRRSRRAACRQIPAQHGRTLLIRKQAGIMPTNDRGRACGLHTGQGTRVADAGRL
jgi:hypothetical protein